MTLATPRRRWRYYRTATGARPVHDYLAAMDSADRDRVRLAMLLVAHEGRSAARHLRGDVYEVRAARAGRAWRVLFAAEGRSGHVLLALSAFEKKTQQAPRTEIERAEARLRDWRDRGRTR